MKFLKFIFGQPTTMDLIKRDCAQAEKHLLIAQSRLEHAESDVMAYSKQVQRLKKLIAEGGYDGTAA